MPSLLSIPHNTYHSPIVNIIICKERNDREWETKTHTHIERERPHTFRDAAFQKKSESDRDKAIGGTAREYLAHNITTRRHSEFI